MKKRRQDTLKEKWEKEGERIYEQNKAYSDSKQSDKDLKDFINRNKKNIKL